LYLQCARNIAEICEIRNAHRVLVGKSLKKYPLGRQRTFRDIIKTCHRKRAYNNKR
jgi:hypothetical protein